MIEGGRGNDRFNIGDTRAGNNGDLDLVRGQMTIIGNGGSGALVVNDAGNKHTRNRANAINYLGTRTMVVN